MMKKFRQPCTRVYARLSQPCCLARASGAQAAWTLNMTPGISDMSREIYSCTC